MGRTEGRKKHQIRLNLDVKEVIQSPSFPVSLLNSLQFYLNAFIKTHFCGYLGYTGKQNLFSESSGNLAAA